MNKLILSLLFISASYVSLSQTSTIVKENWEAKPVLHKIDPKYANEGAVVLLDRRRIELIDEANNELAGYQTLHKIIRVNDDRGIESFNKFYLGVTDNADIVDIRARTILPDHRVVEIDRKNVKDMQDEDGSMYKIFAVEGLTKGCEVEYIFTFRRNASYFGREIVQGAFPVVRAEIEVITPERLIYEGKSYNATLAISDTILEGKRFLRFLDENVPGADEEKYSFYRANLHRAEYKLSYNLARSKERIFTWNELAKRIHEIYSVHTEKETKRIAEFVKKNKWASIPDEVGKVCAIENLVKTTFANREDISSEEAANIESILKNKIASNTGIVRLYSAIFKQLDIPFQLVLSGDRQNFVVDKEFENWNNTDNIVFYFPNLEKYIAPTLMELRYPWMDPHWAGTTALFCKTTTIGNFTTAVAEVNEIPIEDHLANTNNIEAQVKFTPKADSLIIDTRQTYSGYSAAVYRSSFNFGNDEQKKEFLKQLVKFNTNSEHIISSKIENQEFENYHSNKPFAIHAVVKSKDLLEQAGNKILFKIGVLIGQQVEMYQEKERIFPMEMRYPHTLARKIEVILPDGYLIKNLDDLKMNKVVKKDNESVMGFVSEYEVKGNVLTINILEEYRMAAYPTSEYAQFREVINAAADFNKIVLVLEKK